MQYMKKQISWKKFCGLPDNET